VPHAAVRWDEQAFGLTKQDVVEALRRGEPQIEVVGGQSREMVQQGPASPPPPSKEKSQSSEPVRLISIVSNTLKPGEEKIIAQRLKEILKPAADRVQSASRRA
jgi:hypothetical protein